MRQIIIKALSLCWLMMSASCGNEGETGEAASETLGPSEDILGSITSQTGSQADMKGWIVVATDRETNISRVAEVNSAGLFTLPKIFTEKVYTLTLLSPAYIVASVLSMPSTKTNTVKQYFKFSSKTLPRLIHKGPIITFQNTNGIAVENNMSGDSNGDSIPDGVVSFSLFSGQGINLSLVGKNEDVLHLAPSTNVDLDSDGIKNILDSDIDGDGIPNVFDSDDDGDAVLDVFDQDSDGDLVADASQTTLDLFYDKGVEWVTIKFEMTPKSDGTYKSNLTFYTKVRSEHLMPSVIQIRGAPSLLNGANVETTDATGKSTIQAWDKRLLDDGKSEDASEGDLLFGRRILLKQGTLPTYHQVIFFQLGYGSGANAWFQEFAYTFPPLTPSAVTPKFDSFSKTVSLVGNPFGSIKDFLWTSTVYDAETNLKVYSTAASPGTTRSIKLPTNVIEAGKKYKFKVTAQVLDRVPGYASYTIESALTDVN